MAVSCYLKVVDRPVFPIERVLCEAHVIDTVATYDEPCLLIRENIVIALNVAAVHRPFLGLYTPRRVSDSSSS